MRPVVGITAWPAAVPQDPAAIAAQAVPDDYLELLDHVGLAALLIPVRGPAGHAAALIGRVDGVLLTGGGDVAPASYAAPQLPETTGVDPRPDPPRPGHMVPQRWNTAAHPVQLMPATLLHRLLGPEVNVNSLHHQAVDMVAPGLRVAGRAPDGVIEAVEHSVARFVVGLQWHPEMLGPDHRSTAVFQQFAAAVMAGIGSVTR